MREHRSRDRGDPKVPAHPPADLSEPGEAPTEGVETTPVHELPQPGADDASEMSYLGAERRPRDTSERALGDFTTTPSVLRLVPLGILVGALGAGISLALLDMIGLFTNFFYYQRLSVHLVSPNANTLGAIALVIPIGGGLVVGLMARFGSEQIRGHGIPEAMENILINGSKVQPRLAILKPISSAISIGTGGPFGAEGPIILTGGAVGSIVGQLFRLTAAQRRALLVAGAAAGMSAVFGTPVAATLFGVELLVFEFKPRSMVLIGLASATADGLRMVMASAGLVSPQPLFPVPGHVPLGGVVLVGAAVIGVATGLGAWVMTQAVYRCEDLFKKLTGHLHWMWWPLIGGLVIGLGGLVDPRALGVGYNTIHLELLGKLGVDAMILLFFVKMIIWSAGLGGGTSGGILAPILMMGAAIGGILGHVLPGASVGAFALIGMSGSLGGVTRSPFTAIVFAFELTHDANSLLALLVAATVAHLVSVLTLKRSILTEKVARRGFHVMREYAVDPLEATFVREVMETDVVTVEPERNLTDLYQALPEGSVERRQRLYPVLDSGGHLVGVLAWSAVLAARSNGARQVSDAMIPPTAVAHPDEILRGVADRMAALGLGALPVVDRADPRHLDGLVTQFDLLEARQKLLEEERHAERVLTLRRVRLEARTSGVPHISTDGPPGSERPSPISDVQRRRTPTEWGGAPGDGTGRPSGGGGLARGLGLPQGVRACLFDLDGVLTETATVRAAAWKEAFDAFLKSRAEKAGGAFVAFDQKSDYDTFVDGRTRLDGVRSFLASRHIDLPDGDVDDLAGKETVHGLAAATNGIVQRRIREDGVRAYEGSVRFARAAREAGLRLAVVSSSANCAEVLEAAGIDELFEGRVDGQTIKAQQLAGKPAPDTYVAAVRSLGVEPAAAAVFEDALSGVEAGRAGSFAFVVGVDRVGQAEALLSHGADVVVADLAELLERP